MLTIPGYQVMMDSSDAKLELTIKGANEQIDTMNWKMDEMEKQSVQIEADSNEQSVVQLMQNVTEVREEYEALRRELGEVQALQRELSSRLRSQLALVQLRAHSLRQRLAMPASPR